MTWRAGKMGRSSCVLSPVPYDDPLAQELVEELQQEYVVRYGGRDSTPVEPAEFTPPDGVFFVARSGEEVVGSVALRRHDATTVELKRLYVRAAHRGRGLGREVLHAVEGAARDLGYRRLVLETGTKQPEALGLYASSGYAPVPPFGHYRNSPTNRCFGRDL